MAIHLVIGVPFVAIVAAAVAHVAAAYGIEAALVAVLVIILATWTAIPRRHSRTPKWLTLLLLAVTFSTLLPASLSLLVQSAALVVGFVLWISRPPTDRRGAVAVMLAATIIVYWAALTLHPNVPDIEVGLLGLRKTTMCVAGFAFGATIASSMRWSVERTLIKVMILSVSVSILIHLFAPGLEAAITRGAGEYTAIFGNQARLQGIFAGPFHVALAGILLVVWAVVRFTRARLLASISLTIGLAAISLALVRTAFVALAVALIVAALVAPTAGRAVKRIAILAGIGIVGISVIGAVSPQTLLVIDSIAGFQDDTRFQGRFGGYQEGIELVQRSPLWGWGAGSAGDTLDRFFVDGEHITSHNVLLKVAVEGGLFGFALWVAFAVAALRATRKASPERTLAAAFLSGIVAMGMTVASTETLPVSFLAFAVVGLCADSARGAVEGLATNLSLRHDSHAFKGRRGRSTSHGKIELTEEVPRR